jgi:hypothetical protein
MTALRSLVLASVGLALAGCVNSLPKPLYALQQTPPPYRKAPDGAIIDNAAVTLDAEGYRLDKNGRRIQEVDVPAKTAEYGVSNPVAGYYISSAGTTAPGNVMEPSEGANVAIGTGSNPNANLTLPSGQPVPQLPPNLMPTPGETPPTTPTPTPH